MNFRIRCGRVPGIGDGHRIDEKRGTIKTLEERVKEIERGLKVLASCGT